MKTAISIPDDTFKRATRRAYDLGVSRSEFFTRAATRYLDDLDATSITQQIDAALETHPDTDESTLDAVAVGRDVLDDASGDW